MNRFISLLLATVLLCSISAAGAEELLPNLKDVPAVAEDIAVDLESSVQLIIGTYRQAAGIEAITSRVYLAKAASQEVSITLKPDHAAVSGIVWSSDNERVATVQGNRLSAVITAYAAGSTVVRAEAREGGLSCEFDVSVYDKKDLVKIEDLRMSNGSIRMKLTNNSSVPIKRIDYVVWAWTVSGKPVLVSPEHGNYFYGSYELPLDPGESTGHGKFTFYKHIRDNLKYVGQLKLKIRGVELENGTYVEYNARKLWNAADKTKKKNK